MKSVLQLSRLVGRQIYCRVNTHRVFLCTTSHGVNTQRASLSTTSHGVNTQRVSLSTSTADKSLLSKLRKKTGFPFINCKNALLKFDNDFQQAEKWLVEQAQKEGWAKATKLQGRAMSHGLVGIVNDDSSTTMIEMNCETDFVARNSTFQVLVCRLADVCHLHFKQGTVSQRLVDQSMLNTIPLNGGSVADLVAREVGTLGENMAIRRATHYRADTNTCLAHHVHVSGDNIPPTTTCTLGKFGAIVEYQPVSSEKHPALSLVDIGNQLCQHIIGINPQSIGDPADFEREKSERVKAAMGRKDQKHVDEVKIEEIKVEDAETVVAVEDMHPDDIEDAENKLQEEAVIEAVTERVVKVEETRLLFQDFMLDDSVKVKEYLDEKGIEVVDFVRYQCGEEVVETVDNTEENIKSFA